MNIAIPVKTNKENPILSPLFGHSKWFAFVKDGKVSIEKNEEQSGSNVVSWLLRHGVGVLIIHHISAPP